MGGAITLPAAETVLPPLIPRTTLFGNPVKSSPRLSPDGAHLAYLAPVANVLNVWVGAVAGPDYHPITNDTDRGIRFYFWGEDSRHILYIQDVGGNENWRLYAVDVTTGATRDLTPFADVQAQVVDHDKHFPDELLVALNKDNPALHDVYRLRLSSGELTLCAKNPGQVSNWIADAQLQVRGAMASTPDGGAVILTRASESAGWQELLAWDADDSMISRPVGFTHDGAGLYLLDGRDANTAPLVHLDLRNGEKTVLAADPEYDVSDVVANPDTHAIQMVSFDKARREWLALDPTLAADLTAIGALHPGDFSLLSRDGADTTWLVAFSVDTGPVAYYSYDRRTRQGRFLFDNQPDLNAYTLAPMEPIAYTTDDGLTIHGYLTRPVGPDPAGPGPLVLNVHGGPWGRDTWGYNPEAQWFANRGYACLQVNFRGSTGYGKGFLNAGAREWGARMHDDLVAAVAWAVAAGVADPARVAIYGGSYGGYAALVGAAFTPDLFCCAVDIVGPSNLVTLLQSVPAYWSSQLAMLHRHVGHPEEDAAFLQSRSPLHRAHQIKIPLLIAQGANDPRVKQAEAEQIVAALQENGIAHEYLLFPDEGHGFAKPDNRLRFYAAAEAFLARHLGGRVEPAPG